MRRPGLAILIGLSLASPASAHKLKVFASVQEDTVSGYAFFIGGGRPQGSSWVATDGEGKRIAEGTTDAEGRFSFQRPTGDASDLIITVDTHEAHIASARLSADRLAAPLVDAAAPTPDARLAATVEIAVQRQIEPVLERIEQIDSRMRISDALSGVFFIFGLAGVTLWARNRRN